jgi:hypothetical protein
MYERGVPAGALNLNSTGYSDHGRYGDLSLQWKIPTAEPGIEVGVGKGGRCVGLTILPSSCADYLEICEPQPPGTLWACPGLLWNCFTFTIYF